MKLNIADRISLQQILPQVDSFENLCLRTEILERIKFSSEEIEGNKIKSEGNQITWSETESKEYEFHSIEENYISVILKKISEEKKLQAFQLSLYKLFVK
jgi:hypothetical protein